MIIVDDLPMASARFPDFDHLNLTVTDHGASINQTVQMPALIDLCFFDFLINMLHLTLGNIHVHVVVFNGADNICFFECGVLVLQH